MDASLQEKLERLKTQIRSMERVAVAFSGGVDSSLLLRVAHDVLGRNVLAVTAQSHVIPQNEMGAARRFCCSLGVEHRVVLFDEMAVPGFAQNPPDRCYLCKKALFSMMLAEVDAWGGACLVDGSNVDDEGDWRPGMRALAELRVASPLREAGFTKADIRSLSRELGLPQWDKPSAACLASRFAYGDPITLEGLAAVDAAESMLYDAGFSPVRVRVHGPIARIELASEQIPLMAEEAMRLRILDAIKRLGFTYVTLDLAGFRSGSMNDVLAANDAPAD